MAAHPRGGVPGISIAILGGTLGRSMGAVHKPSGKRHRCSRRSPKWVMRPVPPAPGRLHRFLRRFPRRSLVGASLPSVRRRPPPFSGRRRSGGFVVGPRVGTGWRGWPPAMPWPCHGCRPSVRSGRGAVPRPLPGHQSLSLWQSRPCSVTAFCRFQSATGIAP